MFILGVLGKVLQGFELGPLGSLLGSPDQGTGSSGGRQNLFSESLNKSAGPEPSKSAATAKTIYYVFTTFSLRFYYVFTTF